MNMFWDVEYVCESTEGDTLFTYPGQVDGTGQST